MKGQIVIKNLHIVSDKIIGDIEIIGVDTPLPTPVPTPTPTPTPVPVPDQPTLPRGYDTNPDIALQMLLETVERHGLNAIAIQGHGKVLADALNEDWSGLRAYAHPKSDAIMWPGFGSLDVTKDSGKGGWYFRPDHEGTYDEAYARTVYP